MLETPDMQSKLQYKTGRPPKAENVTAAIYDGEMYKKTVSARPNFVRSQQLVIYIQFRWFTALQIFQVFYMAYPCSP